MATNENEAPLSESARDLDDKVRDQISDLTDLDVRRPEKKTRNLNERTRRLFSNLIGKKGLRRLENWDIPPALLVLTILFVLLIVYLAVFVLPGDGDGDATGPQPTAVQATAAPSVAPTPDSAEVVAAPEPDADDSRDEGGDEVTAILAPIAIHADVADGNVSSFYQLWSDAAVVVTPRLVGGTVDMMLDFEAMTALGSFDLTYERSSEEDEDSLCVGSPEAFSGTARGAFEGLPIRETPPSAWNIEGWIQVELAMSGSAVMSCATLDGDTDFAEIPIDGTATITSSMRIRVDVATGQGADDSTVMFVDFTAETDEPSSVKPFWRHRVSLTETIDQPLG